MRQVILKDKAITLSVSKDTTTEQLQKSAENLIDFLQRKAKKQNLKGKIWTGKMILCVSNHDGKMTFKYFEKTGGREKELFFEHKNLKWETKLHIHMMLLEAYPVNGITKELNGYWKERQGEKKADFRNFDEKIGGKLGFYRYMYSQSNFFRGGDLEGTKEYKKIEKQYRDIVRAEVKKLG